MKYPFKKPFRIIRLLLSKIYDPDKGHYECGGFELYIKSNASMKKELRKDGSHEYLTSKAFYNYIKPGMTVVDIGANIGYFTGSLYYGQ